VLEAVSMAEDEEHKRRERAQQVGLFRYMLIRDAADGSLSPRQRGAKVRELAGREHTDPFGRPVRVSRWTLDFWIRQWRRGGFEALVPSVRQTQPRTPEEVLVLARALKRENPDRSAAQVRRILFAHHGWAPDERTLQRMFVREGLTALARSAPPVAGLFGRFEATKPNELWTGDALHGERVDGRKTYL
jgi:putative transposase